MRIILLGAPGAGKGTQAQFLQEALKTPVIATGDMLRKAIAAKTKLGLKAKSIMDEGKLISDDIIIPMVLERISEADCKQGYIFDGFPRTLPQAQALRAQGLNIDCVINFVIDDNVIIERLSGRRVHPGSGRTYHITNNPPHTPGQDNVTGEPLVQRKDDEADVIRERLNVYHQQTEPLVQYYKDWTLSGRAGHPHFITISAEAPVESIHKHLLTQLNSLAELSK